jgi:hypothetical protein
MKNCKSSRACPQLHIPLRYNLFSSAIRWKRIRLRNGTSHILINLTFFFSLFSTSLRHCTQIAGQATILTKEPTVQIQCMSGSMIVSIKNAPASYDGLFSGLVYPKGLSKNSTCLAEYM